MFKTRILLAEDNPDHQHLLQLSLTKGRPCVEVKIVSNRCELLEVARTERFDCLVLDFNLGVHTAPELLANLSGLQEGVPRIVVSSSEEQRVVIDSIRRGGSDFVHKDDAVRGCVLWNRVESAMAEALARRTERRVINRRMRALARRVHIDPLTGLLNRAGIEAALSADGRRSDRRAQSSVVFIDLDHFKRVNDTLGHCAGDQVLCRTADVIKSHLRGGDLAARWGGEEFVVIRQSETLTEAWIWADNLRRSIESQVNLPHPLGPQTASIGVEVTTSDRPGASAINRADHAMYFAKETGRNRVCTWPMVHAANMAYEIGADPSTTSQQRLSLLLQRLRCGLGVTQLEHTGPHGERVRNLANLVARRLNLPESQTEHLQLAAEFHDIGKIGVPEPLLALPRLLSEDERRFINEHARFGAELLRAVDAPDAAAQTVHNHHHRFDEAPTTAAPDLASVVAACDALVSMISLRAYTKSRDLPQALCELRAERGRQFHPGVVDAIHALEPGQLAAA